MSAPSWAQTAPATPPTRCFGPIVMMRIRRRFATASGARDDCRDLRGVARLRPQGGLSRHRRDAEARSGKDGWLHFRRAFPVAHRPGQALVAVVLARRGCGEELAQPR